MPTKFLRWLGRAVYTGVLPVQGEAASGAERFLEDLWAEAPARVAAAHTAAALLILALPIAVLGKPRLFSGLARRDQERMLSALLASRRYWARVLAQAVKGAALVAILRLPEARARLLAPRP